MDTKPDPIVTAVPITDDSGNQIIQVTTTVPAYTVPEQVSTVTVNVQDKINERDALLAKLTDVTSQWGTKLGVIQHMLDIGQKQRDADIADIQNSIDDLNSEIDSYQSMGIKVPVEATPENTSETVTS